ncbi:MAG: PRC-barrel domain-containing protein [Euryarchaeota archaeon]|jgi:sporulation protein YlmC with PRC-barrel domain|nr:PRC-barrel domain-containing protein [Euryarchaeota archaeon]HNS24655.1 PRC-barrel domain-containing protein [Methanobacteriaceae archaeon]
MKATDFIGTVVIDKQAREVGKVADISVTIKKCLVDKVIVVTGSALKRNYFAVVSDEIAEIGDYMQLTLDEAGVEAKGKVDKIEQLPLEGDLLKTFLGKEVLSEDALIIGKVEDMLIDPKGCLIHNVVIATGSTFRKKNLIVSDDDIKHIGDYVILEMKKEKVEELLGD